jgi:hypothetical protein
LQLFNKPGFGFYAVSQYRCKSEKKELTFDCFGDGVEHQLSFFVGAVGELSRLELKERFSDGESETAPNCSPWVIFR